MVPLPSWRWPGHPHCSGGAAVGGLVSSITISVYKPPGQQGMVWEAESRLFWAPTFRGTLRRGCFSFPCQQIPFVQRSVPSVTPCGVQVSLLRPTELRLSGVSALSRETLGLREPRNSFCWGLAFCLRSTCFLS